MNKLFEVTSRDGRSAAQTLIDFVKNAQAGTLFSFEALAAPLRDNGLSHDKEAVRSVCSRLARRLLHEHQMALDNVRGVGYRVAPASDHHRLALNRTKKADFQMKRGLDLLKNVRWSEMDQNARQAHEGSLMVLSSFYAQQQALEKRLRRVEDLLDGRQEI